MATNKSIRDFFKPAQPIVKLQNAPTQPTLQSSSASRIFPAPQVANAITPTMRASNSPKPAISKSQMAETPSSASKASDQRDQTLSSSPPPSTDLSEPTSSPLKENIPFRALPNSDKNPERVIQNSDDEDDDSDSEIEDLTKILAARSSARAREANNGQAPSTPTASRQQRRTFNFHASPLAVLPKYKIDMKTLIDHVQADEATEASSKRVKAMIEARTANGDGDDMPMFHDEAVTKSKLDTGALIDSVVADGEEGKAQKVKRALLRTEATVPEKRWYFFDTKSTSIKTTQNSFPTASIPQSWKAELSNPKIRQHTFLSGFAEDMVGYGKKLPDELFLWMLDEICYESNDPLRHAYINVLKASQEQVGRLVDPLMIQTLFVNLGAASGATIVTEKVIPVNKLSTPYSQRIWVNLLSVIKLLGRLAKSMMLAAKTYTICMLLRVSMDKFVSENIDIFDTVQETINRLCLNIPVEREWTTCCFQICTVLFSAVEDATLRLQTVEVISSIHPRTHDLRRRLAMCFYFNDVSYAKDHSHSIMDMDTFINRLHAPEFDTTPETDYRELTSLILLLDIALDDGRSTKLDLSDLTVEERFNEDVDALSLAIKDIFNGIGNPGAAFISRIEAKEVLELVSQRILDTVRTKRKAKHTWFDDDMGKKTEDLQSMKKGMADFVSKMKGIGNGVKREKVK